MMSRQVEGSSPSPRPDRLYAIVRRDHPEGVRASMAAHAFRRFAAAYPTEEAAWYATSNTIVILEVGDAAALAELAERAAREPRVLLATYLEPELGLAALALYGQGVRRLTSSLPLALRSALRASLP